MIMYKYVNLALQNDVITHHYGETRQVSGFDYTSTAAAINGPVIELAGPTLQGYAIIQNMTPKPAIVTNIDIDQPIDVVADGRQLLYGNSTVGMVLVSCLPLRAYNVDKISSFQSWRMTRRALAEYQSYDGTPDSAPTNLRIQIIREIARVLEPGGLLVWRGSNGANVKIAQMHGLQPKMWMSSKTNKPLKLYDQYEEILFQKIVK